jgi:pyrimidine operon attenuation protein/uracil phosphoribosyltransferase
MFNTAFLQLTIVLVGIVSRNNALASALLDNLSSIIPCVHAVFEVLEVSLYLASTTLKMSKCAMPFIASSVTATQVIQIAQKVFVGIRVLRPKGPTFLT